MRILLADDDVLALKTLEQAVAEVCPSAELFSFSKPLQLLAFVQQMSFFQQMGLVQQATCDIAFLDIHMPGMNGIEVALELKNMMPRINIIFVTGFDEYAGQAMAIHASGYIKKPVTAEKIKAELDDLRYPAQKLGPVLLRVRCFGNFQVHSAHGEPLHFVRSKAKEVLAYLVYRQGASCTIKELAAVLFEDAEYDKKQQNHVQKIIGALINALRSVNAEEVLVKSRNSLSIDTTRVDCDYYRFLDRDTCAVNSYSGEFMSQYSWAEPTVGYLDRLYRGK